MTLLPGIGQTHPGQYLIPYPERQTWHHIRIVMATSAPDIQIRKVQEKIALEGQIRVDLVIHAHSYGDKKRRIRRTFIRMDKPDTPLKNHLEPIIDIRNTDGIFPLSRKSHESEIIGKTQLQQGSNGNLLVNFRLSIKIQREGRVIGRVSEKSHRRAGTP